MSNSVKNTFSDATLNTLHQRVVAEFGELPPISAPAPEKFFGALCESIISQQLSTKVADVIQARAVEALGGSWQPASVLESDPQLLRSVGLSNAKVAYVKNIAQAWTDGSVQVAKLQHLPDEAVIEQLVQIKGVGRWTAEMFLIFTLARTDIFSAGDYGLRKAISIHYNYDLKAKPAEFITLAQQWQPQRTLASRILWKSLELSS